MSADTRPAKRAFILTEEEVKKIDDEGEENPNLLAAIVLEAQQGDPVSLEYLDRSKYDVHGAEEIATSLDGRITAQSGVLVTFTRDEKGNFDEIDKIVHVPSPTLPE